ncbi:MAG TPA: VOC family protein [Candidatus Saccharimonadales bacterium]|jgi:catechol 2,3-dioxygenase-like lactoylglutathione lyase family enzyme
MITTFLHTGIEVEDLDKAITLYIKLGFHVVNRFEKPEPRAYVAQLESENVTGVELWQFMDTKHPQVEYIRQHIAVASDNLEADIKELVRQGCEVVIPITKGVTLTYAFLRDPSGNYIEIAKR